MTCTKAEWDILSEAIAKANALNGIAALRPPDPMLLQASEIIKAAIVDYGDGRLSKGEKESETK